MADIIAIKPTVKFDFWHDRAVFHFLTDEESITKYVDSVGDSVAKDGNFLLGTSLKLAHLNVADYH